MYAERKTMLTWQPDFDRSVVAAGPEFDYRIADRRSVFVASAALRPGRGRLFHAEHRPRVIGVTRSLREAKDLCEQHQSKTDGASG
jgi:hypothetical protein